MKTTFLAPLIALGVGMTSLATAATILQNFESTSGSTVPAGWNLVTAVSGTYATTTGHDGSGGGSGNAGTINSTGASGPNSTPGAYLVNTGTGMTAFNVSQTITGSFDINLAVPGSYDSGAFMFGDIGDGVQGTNAGELMYATFNRSNFGNDRQDVNNGLGTQISNEVNVKFVSDTWYEASFSWTPTSGRTGTFSISVSNAATGSALYAVTTDPFTFNKDDAYFAFGDIDATSATYDNISITGTVVPEPSVAMLGAIGSLLLLRRRRA
jgi:hypothetical protein